MGFGSECCSTDSGDSGGCCSSRSRGFLTRTEKIARLEEYQTWLENEAQGVKEAISGLKKAS